MKRIKNIPAVLLRKSKLWGIVAVALVLTPLVLGYTPTPAPTLPPTDPNYPSPSDIMGKKTIFAGDSHIAYFDIVTLNGEALKVECLGVTLKLESTITIVDNSINDPNFYPQKYTYSSTFLPPSSQAKGIVYFNVIATNLKDPNLVSSRSLEYSVIKTTAPVFTGCRMN